MPYIGRFAPSPTGPLHRGSLVAAMASFLDARAHKGTWLVRIEDIDTPRCPTGTADAILTTLTTLGMQWDGEVVWQSRRSALYDAALNQLAPWIYPCSCTRREITDSRIGIAADGAAVYPGTCRRGLAEGKAARAFRVSVPDDSDGSSTSNAIDTITFNDLWMGTVSQRLATEVGDFVLKRADGLWAYQLAVVVDDADQAVTHVVRGADLLDSTPRQIYLQKLLGVPMPAYLHVPVVTNAAGEKLSKQTEAMALDMHAPLAELLAAAQFLKLEVGAPLTVAQFWESAVAAWQARHVSCTLNA